MSRGDFHLHSTCSDGRLAPAELVALAAGRGVRALALTDHDTTAGIPAARAAAAAVPGLVLVPGVELSCDVPGTEVHMLGLGIDPDDAALGAHLAEARAGRLHRGERMVERLQSLGYPLEWARVRALAGDAPVGRPHVAQALLDAGHTATYVEAFERLIGRDGPAYVERPMLTPAEAVGIIRRAGGLAVFAHPLFTEEFERFLPETIAAGLFGLEVYYRHHGPAEVARLEALAARAELFGLGGTDFHGIDRPDEREPGDLPLPDGQVDAFLRTLQQRGGTMYGGPA